MQSQEVARLTRWLSLPVGLVPGRRVAGTLAAASLVVAVGFADYLNGAEFSLAGFYLIGVAAGAWWAGRGIGFALVFASVGLGIAAEVLGGGGGRRPEALVANAVGWLAVYSAVVYLLMSLRQARREVEVQIQQKNAALAEQMAAHTRVEEVLRENEERLRALADAAFEGIIIHEAGRIVDLNHGATETFGYSLAEVAGHPLTKLVAPTAQDLVRSALASGFDQTFEAVGQRKDGGTFEMQIQGGGIRYLGRTLRVAAVRDLTETRRALRQIHVLQAQKAVEAERSRIARDMHDALGAGLTQIKLLAELLERDRALAEALHPRVRTIAQTSRELAESVDQIVWAVNPEKDRLEHLAFYLGSYTEQLLGSTSVRYRMDIPSVLPDVALAAGVRHRVFLAAKEALNNALKHAQPSEIRLKLVVERDQFRVCVEDNGCGFQPGQTSPDRNGLRNIRQGLAEVDGRCAIESQPGQGTRVALSVKL